MLVILSRGVKEENEEYRAYSLQLRKHGVVDQKLIPLFVSFLLNSKLIRSSKDETVLTLILKIFVCYSLPIKSEDACYTDMRNGLLRFADSLIKTVFQLLLFHCRTLCRLFWNWFRSRLSWTVWSVVLTSPC